MFIEVNQNIILCLVPVPEPLLITVTVPVAQHWYSDPQHCAWPCYVATYNRFSHGKFKTVKPDLVETANILGYSRRRALLIDRASFIPSRLVPRM